MTQVLEPLCTVYHRVFKMKKSTRRKCESSRRTIAPRKRCLAVLEGKCRRGIPPPAGGGGGGGHSKFLNFAYPEMHSGAFLGQKSVCLALRNLK